MTIKLELTLDEVNGILAALGELPTSSGAWPLVVKIKQQAEPQLSEGKDHEENVDSGSN